MQKNKQTNKQSKTKQNKAKQNKPNQTKPNQNKTKTETKQNKTKKENVNLPHFLAELTTFFYLNYTFSNFKPFLNDIESLIITLKI